MVFVMGLKFSCFVGSAFTGLYQLLAQATRAPTAHDRQWFSQLTTNPQSAVDATENGVPV